MIELYLFGVWWLAGLFNFWIIWYLMAGTSWLASPVYPGQLVFGLLLSLLGPFLIIMVLVSVIVRLTECNFWDKPLW